MRSFGLGFGGLALAGLLGESACAAAVTDPLAGKRAAVDSFDHKPDFEKADGQTARKLPKITFAAVSTAKGGSVRSLLDAIEKLKAIPEGDGTLLDHCVVTMGSGISDGDSHNCGDLQVLLAGGAMKRGHLHHEGQRPLADLQLTLLQTAGVKRERFADSTGPLAELAL